jgi:hypothetical protein
MFNPNFVQNDFLYRPEASTLQIYCVGLARVNPRNRIKNWEIQWSVGTTSSVYMMLKDVSTRIYVPEQLGLSLLGPKPQSPLTTHSHHTNVRAHEAQQRQYGGVATPPNWPNPRGL